LPPRAFCLIWMTATSLVVLGEVFWPLQLQAGAFPWAIMAMFWILIPWAALMRVRADRHSWYSSRQVMARARAWHEARKAEADATLRAAKAEAATSARSRLVRVVMHDLRSPLLSVRNMADTLAEAPREVPIGDEALARMVRGLQTCTKLMEDIVSDMLDFERIDSGRMILAPRPFSIGALFADARLAYGSLAEGKHIALVFEALPPGLRDGQPSFVGDPRRLLQCIGNGITNAIKVSACDCGSSAGAVPAPRQRAGAAPPCLRLGGLHAPAPLMPGACSLPPVCHSSPNPGRRYGCVPTSTSRSRALSRPQTRKAGRPRS